MTTYQFLAAGLVGFLIALPIVLLLNPPTTVVNKFCGDKTTPNVDVE